MKKHTFENPNFTQVPNSLFDEIMGDMGESELKVVLAIIRKTKGWNKTHDRISVSQLEKLTKLSRRAVFYGIERAIQRGIIEKEKTPKGNIYGLVQNMHPQDEEVVQNMHQTSAKYAPQLVQNMHPQNKDLNTTKQNKKPSLSEKTKNQASTIKEQDYFNACFELYKQHKRPEWVNHKGLNKTDKNNLRKLREYVGGSPADAITAFEAAIKQLAQTEWTHGKNLTLVNLASNDKLCTMSDTYQNTHAQTTPAQPNQIWKTWDMNLFKIQRIEGHTAIGKQKLTDGTILENQTIPLDALMELRAGVAS